MGVSFLIKLPRSSFRWDTFQLVVSRRSCILANNFEIVIPRNIPQRIFGCVNKLFPQNEFLSWRIADYLISCGYFGNNEGDFYSAIEWLNLCSGLETVNIVPNKYDEGLLYCGSAWDYEVSKSNLSSERSKKLVRLHFAWGSLESIIAALIPVEKIERYGKVNALCGYLRLNYLSDLLPHCYLDEYCHLISLMRDVKQYQKRSESTRYVDRN